MRSLSLHVAAAAVAVSLQSDGLLMPRYTVVAQDTCENGPPAEASAGSQAFAIPHQLWQAVALPLWLVYDACRINWLFATHACMHASRSTDANEKQMYGFAHRR